MSPSFFADLASGFSGTVNAEVKRQQDLDAQRRETEGNIFRALLQSDDPELAALALTGLMESATPGKRKKGLRGFMGEMEGSPMLGQLRTLLNTPVPHEELQWADRPAPEATKPPTVASFGSMALPAGSPVESSTPPMTVGMATPLPTRRVGEVKSVMGPRRMFMTSEEREAAQREGRITGTLRGIAKGGGEITPELSTQVGLELAGFSSYGGRYGAGGKLQHVNVEMPDGTQIAAVFDPDPTDGGYFTADPSRQRLVGAMPLQRTASTTLGIDREAGTRILFPGRRSTSLNGPEMEQVDAWVRNRIRETSYQRGTGAGRAEIETKLASPIGMEAGATQGVSPTTPLKAFEGVQPLMPQQREARDTATLLQQQVRNIQSLIGNVLPRQSEMVGGLLPGAVLRARRLQPQYRTAIASLESAVATAVGTASRVLQGQRGAQSERDADRAYQALVKLQDVGLTQGDTVESATARLQETLGALDNVLRLLPNPPAQLATPPPGTEAGASTSLATPSARPTTPATQPVAGIRTITRNKLQLRAEQLGVTEDVLEADLKAHGYTIVP